jgi:hypothetical protein
MFRKNWRDFAYMMSLTVAISLGITLLAYGLGFIR